MVVKVNEEHRLIISGEYVNIGGRQRAKYVYARAFGVAAAHGMACGDSRRGMTSVAGHERNENKKQAVQALCGILWLSPSPLSTGSDNNEKGMRTCSEKEELGKRTWFMVV